MSQIANSIKAFGFVNPILVDQGNTVVAGHGRLAGAELLGMTKVPTIRLENLSPDQLRAYVLADNRLAEKAGWDPSILAVELQHLITIDGNIDVTVTGFEIPEIDLLLSSPGDKPDTDDTFDPPGTSQAVTQHGDVWQLGRHRVLCGNSLQEESYLKLMGRRRASVVFTDPPYNVKIHGHATGNGRIRHREFSMAAGEMTQHEFVAFLDQSLGLMARFSANGSIHFVCIDWRHIGELHAVGKMVYDSVLNVCVWVKNSGGMGSFYRSQHELVFVFRNGKQPHRNNIQLGKFGRNRTNVWQYPSVNTLSKHGEEGNLLAVHPTIKPVAMVADAILDCSARGDLVLDGFLGSGSTLIAAERTGRCCCGVEIDPIYIDVAIRRWERHTGDHAIHVASGKRFDDLEQASEDRLEAHD